MKTLNKSAASTMIILSGAIALGADPQTTQIIEEMAETIEQNYVFPEMGEQASSMLLSNLKDGVYDGLAGDLLAQNLREDLLELTQDRHFGVRAMPDGWEPPSTEEQAQARQAPQAPYGFVNIERISGNIGYIDLRGFAGANYIEDTVEAAMLLLQGSSSIIFDLRYNGGGDPAAVQLITSYLFDPTESVHLNSLYSRPNDHTTEYWTHDKINTDLAMPDTPVYVLTSDRTFSAAEEFSYNLKNLQRATLVGETTGGGAHPVESVIFENKYMVIIPIARAINPISGTNWEGTGVSPDIQIDADEALDMAIAEALESAYESGDESVRWGLATVRARLNPITLTRSELEEIAGDYSDRHVRIMNNGLQYRRDGVSDWSDIVCFERDQFIIPNLNSFIMEFERDDTGSIVGIRGHYEGRHTDFSALN